ncbi:MAG: response regulator [Chloroflexi bacterium]|nr:response regulator [Chloroflexota bacterium]
MPSVPRIVVVDPSHDVSRIVHGALALLNRQYILIEVPTSDDALEEVLKSQIDLLVSAYRVPGQMNGVELATSIRHETLGTPVIVLGEEGDPNFDKDTLKEAPFQYFLRPVAEPFLRGMRIALDGEAAIEAEAAPSTELDLGPLPKVDLNALRNEVMSLMRDVAAMGIIVADRTGRVLIDEGATGYIDREKLAAILGPTFARTVDIGTLMGGDTWAMHYYDGERLDLFGLSLGVHYFMCLLFDGSNRGAFGGVTRFGRRAADKMIGMIGEAAYQRLESQPLPAPKAPETPAKTAPAPHTEKAKAPAARPEPKPAPAESNTIPNFDPDALFAQPIDENVADSMFDPDRLSALARSLSEEAGLHVDYDDAINMGILDE